MNWKAFILSLALPLSAFAAVPAVGNFDTNNFRWTGQAMQFQQAQALGSLALTNNGLTVTRPAGATSFVYFAQASINGIIADPRNFGAKIDGITDDAPALQAAVNYVQSQGGGTVRIPSGTMLIKSTVTAAGNNVNILGAGTTIKSGRSDTTDDPVLLVLGRNLSVDGVVVDANGKNARGLQVNGTPGGLTKNVTLQNCEIKNCFKTSWAWAAITISAYTGSSSIENVTVFNCYAHDNTNASGVSVYADNGLSVRKTQILNSRFYNNQGKDIVFDQHCTEYLIQGNHCEFNDGAIHLENDGIGQVIGNVITNCNNTQTIIGVPGHAIVAFLCHDVAFIGNVISDVPTNRYGFYLGNTSQNLTLTGNEVIGGQYGVVCDSSAEITVNANTFLNPQRNGVYMHSVTHGTVIGNTVGDPNVGADTNSIGNGAGIYIDSCLFVDAQNNLCYDDRFGAFLMPFGLVERFGGSGNALLNNVVRNAVTNAVYREAAFCAFNWSGTATGDIGATNATVGSIYAAGGNIGKPAYSFGGYPSTGMDLWGADDLALVTSGSARVRVNSGGLLPVSRYPLGSAANPWGDAVVHSLTTDGSLVMTNAATVFWYDAGAHLRNMLKLDASGIFQVSQVGFPVNVNDGLSAVTLYSQNALQTDADATAGNTRMLLWDVTAGSLKRVSVGASDSGGAGFKLLRVAN